MASKKIRDIVGKVGEYQDRNSGQTKGRFENVGALMESDNNGEISMFIMLKRTFNPAGVPGQDARESLLLSCYVPQDKRDGGGERRDDQGQSQGGSTGGGGYDSRADDTETPF